MSCHFTGHAKMTAPTRFVVVAMASGRFVLTRLVLFLSFFVLARLSWPAQVVFGGGRLGFRMQKEASTGSAVVASVNDARFSWLLLLLAS